jgi:cytochrome c551/c552
MKPLDTRQWRRLQPALCLERWKYGGERRLKPAPLALCFLALGMLAAAQIPGSTRRGAVVMRDKLCLDCHRFEGAGAGTAPDLSRHPGVVYTQAQIAGLMWNHAPMMWKAMESKRTTPEPLRVQEVNDLFAYLYAARYFEPPGDAARGKAVFAAKRCTECHDPVAAKVGPPVSKWPEVGDPVAWIREMWNHAGKMSEQMQQKKIPWPALTAQELADLLVYFKNLPEARSAFATYAPADPQIGGTLFEQKGCTGCHVIRREEKGFVTLPVAGRPVSSLTGVAAALWNHAPDMQRRAREKSAAVPGQFSASEMNHLIAYLFWSGFFDTPGDARRGQRLFAAKQCSSCHKDLPLAGKASPAALTAAVWTHGPKMLAEHEKQGRRWPQFSGSEMPDLIAFLNEKK